jgi:CRISPR-associated exonuclease Cas4
MVYQEDDYLLLSGIQHYAFCPRQWALIHLEAQWAENYLTAGGRILHNKAHSGSSAEKRGGLLIFRGLKVSSAKLGLSGECDIVEFYQSSAGITLSGYDDLWQPYPVEYKHGKTKLSDCDRLQLCAQAICLEEMLCIHIPSGALFYGQPRRREAVAFTPELRAKLRDMALAMHRSFNQKHTPGAVYGSHCKSCSLRVLCLPELGKVEKVSVTKYMEMHVG